MADMKEVTLQIIKFKNIKSLKEKFEIKEDWTYDNLSGNKLNSKSKKEVMSELTL